MALLLVLVSAADGCCVFVVVCCYMSFIVDWCCLWLNVARWRCVLSVDARCLLFVIC